MQQTYNNIFFNADLCAQSNFEQLKDSKLNSYSSYYSIVPTKGEKSLYLHEGSNQIINIDFFLNTDIFSYIVISDGIGQMQIQLISDLQISNNIITVPINGSSSVVPTQDFFNSNKLQVYLANLDISDLDHIETLNHSDSCIIYLLENSDIPDVRTTSTFSVFFNYPYVVSGYVSIPLLEDMFIPLYVVTTNGSTYFPVSIGVKSDRAYPVQSIDIQCLFDHGFKPASGDTVVFKHVASNQEIQRIIS